MIRTRLWLLTFIRESKDQGEKTAVETQSKITNLCEPLR